QTLPETFCNISGINPAISIEADRFAFVIQWNDIHSVLPFRKMSLFAQKSRPEMVATIYGSSQAQLSERLGIVTRCDARFTADI
ncbi:hypothetical protein, partial [Escherichia coli]|uniref:hypothetical protein n=1 Tax=Escherichia coli TaxID=562 RepID=UPI001BC85BE1